MLFGIKFDFSATAVVALFGSRREFRIGGVKFGTSWGNAGEALRTDFGSVATGHLPDVEVGAQFISGV